MSIYQQQQEETTCSIFLDELYCEEETWEENNDESSFLLPITPSSDTSNSLRCEEEGFMFWEEQELENLFKKEKQGNINIILNDVSMINERKENIEWMLKVKSNYGFCGLTLILSVNYFDRFISSITSNNNNKQVIKPWTIQLAAVTCLSLAAKVEETFVPFLLDLQVEGARPVFEPRDVQKMELLVLSTLEWKMHPITPVSFLDHIIRKLGLNNHLHWEFLTKCEHVLLSLLSDWRFVGYLPSVLAAATMMHVIDQIHHISNPHEYQTHLLSLLNLTKEKVNDCYEKIVEKSSSIHNFKRKLEEIINNNFNNNNNNNNNPSSPSGVIDAYAFSSDSSNDSWVATSTSNNNINNNGTLSALSSPVSSSPLIARKKGRVHEQSMPLQLTSTSRGYVDFVASPR